MLADPKRAVPAYDAILIASPQAAADPRLVAAVRPLLNSIGPERMRRANYLVDRDVGKQTPEAAARWLSQRR